MVNSHCGLWSILQQFLEMALPATVRNTYLALCSGQMAMGLVPSVGQLGSESVQPCLRPSFDTRHRAMPWTGTPLVALWLTSPLALHEQRGFFGKKESMYLGRKDKE